MAVASRANWRLKPPDQGTPLSSDLIMGSLVAAVVEEGGRGKLSGCGKYGTSAGGTQELQVEVPDL